MSDNLFALYRSRVVEALALIVPDLPPEVAARVEVTPTREAAHGDMATNAALLAANGVRHDLVAFRADDDRRPANLQKRDAVRALRGAGFLPVLAVDDDASNEPGYRREHVPFLLVGRSTAAGRAT